MAEAPVLSTKNNNNNISPQPRELGLSQRQSGGGELVVLEVLEVLALVVVFGCPANVARHSSSLSVPLRSCSARSRCLSTQSVHRPAAERSVSDGDPSARFPCTQTTAGSHLKERLLSLHRDHTTTSALRSVCK